MDARTQIDGEAPKKRTLSRTGGRDISFDGWLIGADSDSTGTGTALRVAIYATVGGKYIVLEERTTQWQGAHDTDTITIVDDAVELYPALLDICGGDLGRITQGAWDEAVKTDPNLAPYSADKIA